MTRSARFLRLTALTGAAFAVGLFAAGMLRLPSLSVAQQPAKAAIQQATPIAAAPATSLDGLSEAFATIADHIRPSVVFIKAGHVEQARSRALPPGVEEFFRQFGGGPPQFRSQPQFQQASGSGFVVSADGYILTNNHVVDGADQVTVRLLDHREFKARVVGRDATTDLAVLKVDAKNLTPAALGNSDAARVGEWVLAVGNPLGDNLTFTVTSGILSAKGRALALPSQTERSIQDFLQTDAAINPGNSGGPLVNVRGEVIGVNSAIASETGYYTGYGFAIPINLARQVMQQLISNGRVERAALGVLVRDASPNDAAYAGLETVEGVLVQGFPDNSPAQKAGIEPGDIIVAVDGKPARYVGELQQSVGFRRPGETVKVEIARKGGVRKTVSVKLLSAAAPTETASNDPTDRSEDPRNDATAFDALGLTVEPLSAATAEQLGLSDRRGLVVTGVTPGGPSWDAVADANRGGPDVIVSVEGTPVASVAELRSALAKHRANEIVTLRVYSPRLQSYRIERIRLADGG